VTIESAEAEYERLLSKRSTPEELATGYWELVRAMDKINITYYNLCRNDEQENDQYP